MNPTESSASPDAGLASRVLRFEPGFTWQGVRVRAYKEAAEHHRGVVRTTLIGAGGEQTAFQVRYFEIAPGGCSTLEHHGHEHAVVVLRGQGLVQLGESVYEIGFGDAVYVAPDEPHQFRNPSATEPFGFLCIVDTERDRPVSLTES